MFAWSINVFYNSVLLVFRAHAVFLASPWHLIGSLGLFLCDWEWQIQKWFKYLWYLQHKNKERCVLMCTQYTKLNLLQKHVNDLICSHRCNKQILKWYHSMKYPSCFVKNHYQIYGSFLVPPQNLTHNDIKQCNPTSQIQVNLLKCYF